MNATSCCQRFPNLATLIPTTGKPKGSVFRVYSSQSLPSSPSSSTRTQIDLLGQLTSSTSVADAVDPDVDFLSGKPTIRYQLVRLVGDRDDDFTLQLGPQNLKKVSAKFLTLSQRRNIKRQEYLNEVSGRNDSNFFAVVGAFVILPPVVILVVAISTGYVKLFGD